MRAPLLILLALAAACAGDGATPTERPQSGVPLFENLGSMHFPITTTSQDAQRYFDQGLRLTYAFNHEEAINSFTEATRRDSSCAMCWWGIAMAHGPNINAAMETTSVTPAFEATSKARALAARTTPIEQALVATLVDRYIASPPADRSRLDSSYAHAMRRVANEYPSDVNVLTLFAEAMLDLRPWNQWTKEGTPQPGTTEAITALEKAMALDSTHPGACHYYIHTIEASPNPERAVPCAERLARLMPGAGHLVHMPAHIYLRTGRYADAIRANEHALHADTAYLDKRTPTGIYPLAYAPHNAHFLFSAASFAGMKDQALRSARDAASRVPLDVLKQFPGFELFTPAPYYAMVQFGDWAGMLAAPAPDSALRYTTGMWYYGRGMAQSAMGKRDDATQSAKQLEQIAQTIPKTQVVFAFHPATHLLQLAAHVLRGDLAEKAGKLADAEAHYRKALSLEDSLLYDEPPPWYQPVRHFLGEVLLEKGEASAAERVYLEDLKRFPENGWSLFGLAKSLKAQGKPTTAVDARLVKAWSGSSVKLTASRL